MGREKHKEMYYKENNALTTSSKNYCEVINKVKKNITPENIGEIILSQIPGISSTTSILMKKYGSLYQLLMAIIIS